MGKPTATAERTITTLTSQGYVLSERGLNLSGGRIIILSAAEIASPTAETLALVYDTFQLDVAPYTRYRSNGSTLLQEGSGGGGGSASWGGITNNTFRSNQFTSTSQLTLGAPVTDGDKVTGNVFESLPGSDPAWGAAGDPSSIDWTV